MFKHFIYAALALGLSSVSGLAQTTTSDPSTRPAVGGKPDLGNTSSHNPSSAAEIRESIQDGRERGRGALTSGFIKGTDGVTPEDVIESGGTRR